MARELSEILKELSKKIPKNSYNPVALPKELLEEQTKKNENDCPICGGVGWLRLDVPVDHPNFGKLWPCRCYSKRKEELLRKELEELSNMSHLRQKTFDNFDPSVHPSAATAFEATKQYAENPHGWIMLCGPCGSGKTHLAAAIVNYSISVRQSNSLFMIVPDLLDYLRETFNPKSDITYDERFLMIREVPLLVLDDLGTENATSWAREKLYQLINHRYNSEMPTVITTNQPPEAIDDRIRSRLSDTRLVMHIVLDAPDYRYQQGKHAPTRKSQRKVYPWP